MTRRLIHALDGADIFLHCDVKTPADVAAGMVPLDAPSVTRLPSLNTARSSWSLVHAELLGVRQALERSNADHIVVMSGNCYPLVTVAQVEDVLAGYRGRSLLELNRLPRPAWSSSWATDGGLWRIRGRFLTKDENVVLVKLRGRESFPIPLWRRRIPPAFELRGGSQWKIYSRDHARILLEFAQLNSQEFRFWRHTFLPEESFIPSFLCSPTLVGDVVSDVVDHHPWMIDWIDRAEHPTWLTEDHYQQLVDARDRDGKLFARKFRSDAAALLSRLDSDVGRAAGIG
jgi:hypothetical protein